MDFLGSVLHEVMDKSLQGLQNQQVAIQHNLANIDTPGYKRKKFDFDNYVDNEIYKIKLKESSSSNSLSLHTTNSRHIKGNLKTSFPTIKKMVYDDDSTLWEDNTGNNINLDRENIAMSKNNIHSTAILNAYQKYSNVYKQAISTLSK